ncbi:MAG: tetratricopeptide repeat protein [Planctomycetia bacterium]|nr:MAG: tetratricopeptide repeat protein [Planctomycetia bacterium]
MSATLPASPHPPPAPVETWTPPTTEIGALFPDGVVGERYRLLSQLGAGAHGYTCRARHELLNFECAVKLLRDPAAQADGPDARLAEARAAFRIRDPNVVRLLDCDRAGPYWYLVLEFVDGPDLLSLLERGRPPLPDVLHYFADAARGLRAIHERGLVHRDVKPANLLLGRDGRVRLTDLGVAALLDPHSGGAEGCAGTHEYAAPECFTPGTPPSAAADLYGLGATMLHLLTGAPPFASLGALGSLLGRHGAAPEWPDNDSSTPEWLRRLVLGLLAPDPDSRPASAAAVLSELARAGVERARESGGGGAVAEPAAARGIAMLGFASEGTGDGDDSWIGLALSDAVGRALARFPDSHIVDGQMVTELAERLGGPDADAALRRAAELSGAHVLVGGWVRRDADLIEVELHSARTDDGAIARAEPVCGHLTNLPGLTDQLLECAVRLLGLPEHAGAPGVARTLALEAHRHFALGKQAYQRGRLAEALDQAEAALALDPDYADPLQYAGAACARLGRYDDAERYHRRQESLAQARGDVRQAVEARANLGVMHYYRGAYAQAHEHCLRAAQTAESVGLKSELANIYSNLGFSLFQLGRLDEARGAFERAVHAHRSLGALVGRIGPTTGLGQVLQSQQRHDEAIDCFRRALALAEEAGDRINVGVSHMNIGRTAALAGRPEPARLELASALVMLSTTDFWNGLARVYEYIADLNLQCGDAPEALRCAQMRRELAERHGNERMQRSALEQEAQALDALGRGQQAAATRAQARAGSEGGRA